MKGNATILASIIAIVLVAAGVGAGTMAWFSTADKTTSTYTMNAATMDMVVTTSPITFPNLVPGQTFGPVTISIANTGTMDINYLGGNLIITDIAGTPYTSDTAPGVLLANWIEITSLKETIPNYYTIESIGPSYGQSYELSVGNNLAPLTLMELAKSYHGTEPGTGAVKDQFGGNVAYIGDWATGYGYDIVPANVPAIAQGTNYQMVLMFKLSDLTPNAMQGQSCSFKIVFTGAQDMSLVP
jgi:hypothetical protein